MLQDDDILQEFVVESSEHLADVESQLLEIEECGANINLDLVNTVFRAIHSVKGAAGFLGLTTINELAHNLENILNQIRNQELTPNGAIVDTMLQAADLLRSMVGDVATSNDVDVSAHVAELKKILAGDFKDEPELKQVAESVVEVAEYANSISDSPKTDSFAATSTPVAESRPILPTENEPVSSANNRERKTAEPKSQSKPVDSNVRVNVSVLDRLMNLAGELVLGRNQLLQATNAHSLDKLEAVAARLDQVTSELQEAIMQTRMQPVGTVFNRFPRVVRDLSAKLGKKIALEIEGSDVEVDKTIIEAIGDPLTHLIRNSVDHGVELPEVRVKNGKPAEGTIRLRAFHQAGKVCIRIEDNGGGIDPAKIKAKALQNGLVSAAEVESMSVSDTLRLIFAPGFSTAAAVTDVSGRGVGMDVVRTNIEQIGGTVDIESEPGKGSAMHITLPLTLAIIPSMIVGCGEEKFAIPQTNIAELVRVPKAEFDERIGNVQGAEVLRLRGALLPLVRLDRVLGIRDSEVESSRGMNVIVVESGQFRYGVAVDDLFDSEEIVVKPLGRQLKDVECLAGATILGDGRIALILDIAGIASHANLRSCDEQCKQKGEGAEGEFGPEMHRLLMFRNAPDEQFAIPMACVSRIERAPISSLVAVGGKYILPYRGGTLPLLSIEAHVTAKPRSADLTHLYIAVFSVGSRELGLIAPELKDICNIVMEVDSSSLREPGVAGVIVADNHPTRLLDLLELTRVANPEWVAKEQHEEKSSGKSILMAEDSAFFRKHVEQTLLDEGYTVTTAVDGQDAIDKLRAMDVLPDVIVTDVEMPRKSGLEFCEVVRSDPRTSSIPVIALTSLASEEDVARGKAVGVDDYQVKLDKNNLLDSIARYLKSGR